MMGAGVTKFLSRGGVSLAYDAAGAGDPHRNLSQPSGLGAVAVTG